LLGGANTPILMVTYRWTYPTTPPGTEDALSRGESDRIANASITR
jgi:hypothetical protein